MSNAFRQTISVFPRKYAVRRDVFPAIWERSSLLPDENVASRSIVRKIQLSLLLSSVIANSIYAVKFY